MDRGALGIFGLTPIAILKDPKARPFLAVYVAVASFCGGAGHWSMSYEQIADRAGCSRRRAMEGVKALIDAGWIGKSSKGDRLRNEYCVLYPVEAPVPAPGYPDLPEPPAEDPEEITTRAASDANDTSASDVNDTSLVMQTSPVLYQERSTKYQPNQDAENSSVFDYSRMLERLRVGYGWMVDRKAFEKIMTTLRGKDPRLAGIDFLEWVSKQMKSEGVANPGREGLFIYRVQSPEIQARFLASKSGDGADPEAAAQLEHRRQLAREYGYPVDGRDQGEECYLTEWLEKNPVSASVKSFLETIGVGQSLTA